MTEARIYVIYLYPAGGPKKEIATHHLDPVPVRVQNKCDMSHLAIRKTFLERHAKSFKARTRLFDVSHRDSDVTESLRLGVARVVWRLFQRLRTVVVGKFEDS